MQIHGTHRIVALPGTLWRRRHQHWRRRLRTRLDESAPTRGAPCSLIWPYGCAAGGGGSLIPSTIGMQPLPSFFPNFLVWLDGLFQNIEYAPPPLPQHYSLNRRGIRYCEMKEQMKGRAGGEGKYWRKTRNAKEGIKRKKKTMKGAKGK